MGDSNNLGDLNVSITGDFSELQTAIDQSVSVAQDGSQQIASALQGVSDASGLAGRDLELFQGLVEADTQAGIALEQSLQDIAGSAATVGEAIAGGAAAALEQLQTAEQGAGEAAGAAAPQIDDIGPAATHAAEGAKEAESGLAGMAESLLAVGEALAITEGLVEFGQEALTVYGTVQSVTIGLTQLTGSVDDARDAVEQIKELAATEPFAFPDIAPTIQKMVALGVSIEQLPTVMQAVADASAATGNAFNAVANSFDRMSLSGTVSARSLVQLGINTTELAAAMGVTDDAVNQAFKDLNQSERIDALSTALGKFAGSAEAQAQGIAGQWQIFKNQFEEVMVAVGDDLAPVISDLLGLAKASLEVTQEVATDFKDLPPALQDVVVVFGLMAAAAVPLTGAVAALGLGVAGLNTLLPLLTGLMTSAGAAAGEEAIGEGAAAVATTAHAEAAAAAIGPIEALEGAELAGATEAGGLATALGSVGTVLGTVAAFVGPAVAAIAVTVENLKTLKAEWNDVDATIKSNSLSAAINAGATAENLQQLGFSVVDLKNHFSDLGLGTGTVMQQISSSINPPMQALTQLGFTEDQVAEAVKGIGTNAVTAFQALTNAASIDDLAAVGLNIDKITAALNRMGAQANNTKADFDSLKLGITVTAEGFTQLSAGAALVQSNVATLNQNIVNAKSQLAELKTASDGSAKSFQDIAVAAANVEKAQKALASAMGEVTQAATVEKNSIQDIAGALATANDAIYNAQQSVARLNQYLADGITELGGWDIATQLLPDALDRLAQATLRFQTATQGGKDSVTGFVNTVTDEIGKLGTLYNSWTQLNAIAGQTPAAAIAADNAFKQMASEAAKLGITLTNTGGVISASVTDPTKASAAAIQGLIDKFPGLNTAVDHTNDVLVNGQTVIAGAQAGFIKFGDDVANAAEQYTPFVGAVDDGTVASGDAVAALNSMANGVVNSSNAVADSTTKLEANTQAKKDNTAATAAADKAAQALAQHQADLNKAWAQGDIVVQSYNGDVAHVVANQNELNTAIGNSTATSNGAAAAYQNVDGKMVAIAQDAITAKESVDALDASLKQAASDAAWEAAGASGLNGMKSSLASVLSAEMAIAEAPSLGGALGGGGVSQGQIDQMAQALADATGQVVTTIDGAFVPAVTRAAEIAAAQSAAAAANTAATSSNTTAKTANTVATQATTTTLTDQQIAYENQFNSLLTNTSATVAATTSTAALATATASAAAGAASLGSALVDASTSAAVAAQVTTAAATAAVTALTTTFGTITGAAAGTTATPGSILAGAGNLGGISDYGPNSQGYTGGELNQSPPGGGVTLNVNVTGNSVTSQALVDQLANKVGSQIITNLRTVAGFKLG